MKKLLAMLTTITSLSIITPIVLANASAEVPENKIVNNEINSLQTNNLKKLNKRQKRAPNEGNELVEAESMIYATFKPNLWEEIIIAKYESGNNYQTFKQKFKDKLNEYYYKKDDFTRWQNKVDVDILTENIFEYWDYVNLAWRNSNKKERIRIICHNKNEKELHQSKIRKDDSIYYENQYLNNQIINEELLNTNLGEIYESKTNNILDAIKIKNPNIDISALSVTDITNNSAKITVISSGKYKPWTWVNVFFKVKQDLNEIITNLNLGALNNNDAATIKDAVKKLNPILDTSDIGVSQITDTSADIGGSPHYNSNKYKSYKKVYFTIKPDLNNDLKTCIDPVNDTNDETILNAFKAKNPNLDISQVYIKEKTPNGWLNIAVKSDSNKYNTNSKVFECNNFTVRSDLNTVITKFNLNLINNSDEAILNEINYLNPDLDISELEIKEKDNISATIRAKSNSHNYFGEKKINYVINQQKNVKLDELIKKAIFFKFRDDNPNLIFKEIKDITTDNLQYSNIELTQKLTPTFTKDIYLNDCNGESNFENETSSLQRIKTKECRETLEIEKRIRLIKGLGRTQSHEQTKATSSGIIKSSEISDVFENSDIKTSSQSHGWNLEIKHEMHVQAGVNAGFVGGTAGSSLGVSAGGHGEYGSSNTKSSSHTTSSSKHETNTSETSNINSIQLMNNVNLENTDEKVILKNIQIVWPSQEIAINPNTKITVSFIINKINYQIIFDLKQDIYGNIQFNILTKNNETVHFDISIGKLMQKLKDYNLLPQEMGLYDDGESVYFDGKLQFSIKKSFQDHIKIKEQELFIK